MGKGSRVFPNPRAQIKGGTVTETVRATVDTGFGAPNLGDEWAGSPGGKPRVPGGREHETSGRVSE